MYCILGNVYRPIGLPTQVSQSIHKMMKVLLPCGKIEYAPYSLENNPFSFYDGRCCYGKCPKREAGAQARLFGSEMRSKVCGWVGIFGDVYCPLEATTDKFTWKVSSRQSRVSHCLSLAGSSQLDNHAVPLSPSSAYK